MGLLLCGCRDHSFPCPGDTDSTCRPGDLNVASSRPGRTLTRSERRARTFVSSNNDLDPFEAYLQTQVAAQLSAFGSMTLELEGESGTARVFDPSFPTPILRSQSTRSGAITYSEQTPQLVADLNNFCTVVVPMTPFPPPPGLCPPQVTPGQLAMARTVARRIVFFPRLNEARVRWDNPNPALFPGEVPGSPVISITFPVFYDFRPSDLTGLLLLELESSQAEVRLQPVVCTPGPVACGTAPACAINPNPQFAGYLVAGDQANIPLAGIDLNAGSRGSNTEGQFLPHPVCGLFPGFGPIETCESLAFVASRIGAQLIASVEQTIGGVGGSLQGMLAGLPNLPASLVVTLNNGMVVVASSPAGDFVNNTTVALDNGTTAPVVIPPMPALSHFFDAAANTSIQLRRMFSTPLPAPTTPGAVRYTAATVTTDAAANPAAAFSFTVDSDLDCFDDNVDLCPGVADIDIDGDGLPDDADGDGAGDACDSCPGIADSRNDIDGDGIDDACDCDADGDSCPNNLSDGTRWFGAPGECFAFPVPGFPDEDPLRRSTRDFDGDSIIDHCDPDDDNDTVPDLLDNCPEGDGDAVFNPAVDRNPSQVDTNGDGDGDLCDPLCSAPGDPGCGIPPGGGFFFPGGGAFAPPAPGSSAAICLRSPTECGGLATLAPICAPVPDALPSPLCDGSGEDFLNFFDSRNRVIMQVSSADLAAEAPFGGAMAAIPDLDGDGLRDVVVGTPAAFGGRGEVIAVGSFAGDVLWRLGGPDMNRGFGASLAAASDWLIVGAPGTSGHRGTPGAVFAYAFASGLPVQMTAIPGTENGERFGGSVVNAGDLTGDGVEEILVGAPAAKRGAGRVDLVTLDGRRLQSFAAPAPRMGLGSDASAILPTGQLPGGVLIGAPNASSGAGTVVFFSWDGSVLWTVDGLGGDALGTSLAQAADFDFDGIAEIAVGAPGADGFRGTVLILDTLGREVTTLRLEESRYFGLRAVVPGDVNADGAADLLASTPSFDGDLFYDDALFFTYLGAGRQQDPIDPPPFTD